MGGRFVDAAVRQSFSSTTEAVQLERGTSKFPRFQCARCFRLGRSNFEYRARVVRVFYVIFICLFLFRLFETKS